MTSTCIPNLTHTTSAFIMHATQRPQHGWTSTGMQHSVACMLHSLTAQRILQDGWVGLCGPHSEHTDLELIHIECMSQHAGPAQVCHRLLLLYSSQLQLRTRTSHGTGGVTCSDCWLHSHLTDMLPLNLLS